MRPRDEMIGETVLGRYRIVARVAKGGMGVVYLARAEGAAGFAKPVVVKRVLPDQSDNEQMARLFVREAHILANLQHPNIVSVIDFGEEDGAYIMVLDYVRAYHLGLWWEHRQATGESAPIDGTIHIIVKVLEALEYAHTLKLPDGTPLDIVHADISPANVLVDTDGQVKLLDFGIARMRGQVTKTTDSKSIRGKFAYLPIEALDGSPPGVATDIYACGVLLYELLTGENPFIGTDETRTIARVISHEPPPVSQLRTDVSTELDAIVARAIAKDRTKRFASAKDFARELRRVQRVPEDEATTFLSALAKRDYAAMPSKPGASLAALEEAWRNPPPSVASSSRLPVSARAQPADDAVSPFASTSLDGSPVIPSKRGKSSQTDPRSPSPSRGNGRMIAAVAAGMVALGAVGGTAIYVARAAKGDDDRQVVVIERNVGSGSAPPPIASKLAPAPATKDSAGAGGDAPVSTGGQPVVPAAPHGTAVASGARSAKPAAPAGDPLSAALAKRQPEIEACFQNNTANVSGTPEVSVRFTIDAEGVVQRAELSPSALAGVPLGQCILGVSRSTRFPRESGPATFRIPLRTRKVP